MNKTRLPNKMPDLKDMKRPQTVLVNFELEKDEHDRLMSRLKEEGVKKVDFFREVVAYYNRSK